MAAAKKSKAKSGSKIKRARDEKSSAQLEEFKDISDDVIESDFVPYACLYDLRTVATKDAELLQTIKITGLSYDVSQQSNLRTAIRSALREIIPGNHYAIWLHTLRRKLPPQPRSHYPDAFSGKLDEGWRATHTSSISYVNELYVTLVVASPPTNFKNAKLLRESFFMKRKLRKSRADMMERLDGLNRVTDQLVKRLTPYGARVLNVVEREGVFYSEQLEFLTKLINLDETAMPVPERDLSHVLTSGEITFGFNAMEVRSAEGVRRFAAILSLKEYKESTLAGIDKFLGIPCELIISQTFDYTAAEEAHEVYIKPQRYLQYSDDKEMAQWMEIDRLVNIKGDAVNKSFGQQQTTIFLIANNVSVLESNVRMVQRALNRLGMVVVREDLRFEECYWSQLPANFPFIARKTYVDTEHLAGFTNLQAAPMGKANGSSWGPPVTIFSTVQNAPYYFNFHGEHNPHTLIIGKPDSGRTTFMHFLMAQARRLPVSIWYLDSRGRSGPLMEAMGGQSFVPGSPNCMLNPLLLPPTPVNREFLALWLSTLADPTGLQLNQSLLAFFQSVINQVLELPMEQRRMSAVIHFVREADGLLASQLQRFAQGGVYGDLFDMPQDSFSTTKLCAWDISRWAKDPATRAPLAGYLLHRLTSSLDRSPTLITMNDAASILDTPLFSMRAVQWLDYLASQNAAALMGVEVTSKGMPAFMPGVSKKVATLFAYGHTHADDSYATQFGLSSQEINTLSYMANSPHHILQKRGQEVSVIQASLATLPNPMLQTLSGKLATAPTSGMLESSLYRMQALS